MMDSGTCRIYTVTDAAENGEMPAPTLHEYGDYEWAFEDRMISYSRQYAAMGVDQQIDRIIRIWRTPVRIGDVVVIGDEQYRIDPLYITSGFRDKRGFANDSKAMEKQNSGKPQADKG